MKLNQSGLLSVVVRIVYNQDSLSKEDRESGKTPYTHYLYFYNDQNDYTDRMKAAWRPGAKAEIWRMTPEMVGTVSAEASLEDWSRRV